MKNPYAKGDGMPIKGQEAKYVQWLKKQEDKKQQQMNIDQRREYRSALTRLRKKMQS